MVILWDLLQFGYNTLFTAFLGAFKTDTGSNDDLIIYSFIPWVYPLYAGFNDIPSKSLLSNNKFTNKPACEWPNKSLV